jgi:polyprenyl-phospho-N-acetylgalactosaminyl synthase
MKERASTEAAFSVKAGQRNDGNSVPLIDPLSDDLWIVIAAYNEQRRIGAVLDDLLKVARNIVVVNDGSRDDTASEVLKRPVWLVRHVINLGQGAALQTGITFALEQKAQHIITFDADGQHCTSDLPVLIDRLAKAEADFALGSRFLGEAQGIPWARKLILRMAVLFTRVLSGVRLTDAHNGLRAMTRRGAEQLHITMNRMEHASEIIDQIARSGLKYIEVPVTIRYTADSLAKGQKTSAALRLGVKLLLERVIR